MSEPWYRSLRGGRLLLAGFLLFLFLLLLARWAVLLYVDLLWFSAQSYAGVFWTQMLWEWGARFLVGAATIFFAWLNLRMVARTFSGIQVRRKFGDLVIQEQLPESYVRWGMLFGCLFLGFWFGAAVPSGTGLQGLLLFNGGEWGATEPILGRDIGFYAFVLPVLRSLSTFGLILTVILAGISMAGYSATGSIGWGDGRIVVQPVARVHLGVLAGVFILVLGLRFYLAPYGLVLDGNSAVQGIFGFADHQARIPAYQMLGFLSVVTAGVIFWGAYRGRLLPVAAGAAALAIGSLALAQVYPTMIQRFRVQPNELARETPYIVDAVDFTRRGFGLDQATRQTLDYRPPRAETWDEVRDRLERLPIWTEPTLLATFRQVEARFQYYDFHEVAFDRYPSGDGVEPVAVSVREVDPAGIPDPNWQNLRLRERYISGMGAVAGRVNGLTEEGRLPMFLAAIPPEFRAGPGVPDALDLTRPSVYVGTTTSPQQVYTIVTPTPGSFLAPDGSPGEPGVDYPGGIRMGSLARTAALAWRFQDANLLFASEVSSDSRLIFRRQARERVQALAPFLYLPEAPYPVVADGRIVWVIEGFTFSDGYPLSREHVVPGQMSINYLRNSVKATVDAVTGETRLYIADQEDPLIQAYERGFPSLFRTMEDMPEEIRSHLRYSRYMLESQTVVMTRFHQDEPGVFHGQQDRWAIATEYGTTSQAAGPPGAGSQTIQYRPEYALLQLPGEDRESYVLSTLFVPQGRENLASFLAARWSPEAGPELLLWDLPVEEQVRGPSQIEAMIEQDPEISEQFSLWRQGGSQVWTGHLHLVPIDGSIFYMEPIFLAADDNAIPEIRRFAVSDGLRVVMRPSVAEAVSALALGSSDVVTDLAPSTEGPEPPPPTEPLVPRPSSTSAAEEALTVLERAEARLREGDWEGFGADIDEARAILRRELGSESP